MARFAHRRVTVLAGGAAALAAAAVLALTLPAGGQDADDDGSRVDGEAPAGDGVATVAAERRDLVERESLDGTLGYGESRQLALGGQGTLTGLAAEGTVVDRGGVLGEVDGEPVVLLLGDRPMWRSLGEGADTADGADIRQLEENLIALGHGTAANLGPNEVWSQATTAAVERWQEAIGLEETGRVDLGAVVFAAGPLRVGSHLADLGSPAGSPALEVTSPQRLVTVDLAASQQGLVAAGQAVDVELPDGTTVPGTVYAVADVVTPGDPQAGTGATVEVLVVLDDAASAGSLDQAPVDVQLVSVQAEAALSVPVEALLALAEGGYAVELASGGLVGVETGAFADGWVEVTPTSGSLAEGDEVVVPA
jgi:hypothetical protein